ncbi:MAG: DUF58 domain-containing protein [Gemmatimonadaceae bacterium]
MTLAPYGALLDAVRGLSWPSRRRASGVLPGTHESRRRGTSPELSEYRAYRQGDDPKQLDWKLLARTDRAFIRLAEERSILSTLFLLDSSASMAFPAAGTTKWDAACRVAIALAAVAHGSGDPVGLIVPTEHGEVAMSPRTRRGTVHEMARALGSVTPQGSPTLAPILGRNLRARRVAIISDFLGDEESIRRGAQTLVAQGGDVHAIHIVAREELQPATSTGLIVDPERDDLRRPLTPGSRAGYLVQFAAWREELARAWRLCGAAFTEVVADDDTPRVVRRVVVA